jgi:hypothetical protein
MKKSLIQVAIVALLSTLTPVRAATRDHSFLFRMGAGFPGDVNRSHPFSVLPGLISNAAPPRFYGHAVLIDGATNSYRGLGATDAAVTRINGVLVRPYPTQQMSGGMSSSIGAAPAPTSGVADFLNEGFILATCNNFAAAPPQKDGAVFVWVAPTAGLHVQGGFEAAATAGSTAAIANARWNGPTDAAGVSEIQVMAL